jgi:hypothetical protein
MEKDLFENSYSNLEYETVKFVIYDFILNPHQSQRFENQLKKAT